MKNIMTLVTLIVFLAIANIASASLVGLYEFEGNLNDTSGYGTPANGTIYGDAELVVDAERGNVLSIRPNASGIGLPEGYVNVGNPDKYDFTDQITIMFWMKESPTDISLDHSYRRIITKGEEAFVIHSGCYPPEENSIQFRCDIPHADFDKVTPGELCYIDGQWTHVACVFNSHDATQRIYIDGELAMENIDARFIGQTLNLNSDPVLFGEIWEGSTTAGIEYIKANSGRGWRGYLDDVQLYDEVLSIEDIRKISGVPEPTLLTLLGLTSFFLCRRK